MKKIYLAVPYSHDDPKVRQHRFEQVNLVASRLKAAGVLVFSPISHTHPIALAGDLPKGWGFWAAYDTSFIAWADEVRVLKLEGWKDSIGVQAEIEIAEMTGKPVTYIEMPTL